MRFGRSLCNLLRYRHHYSSRPHDVTCRHGELEVLIDALHPPIRGLADMLSGLQAPAGALVVMDRGIVAEGNLSWLRAHGYRYLVVSRERARQFDPLQAVELAAAGGQCIRLHKVLSANAQEVRLYCHSPGREQKEMAIIAPLTQRFEQGLAKLYQGLAKPRGEKRLIKITERIDRLKEKCRGVGQHYRIEYHTEPSGKKRKALSWTKEPVPGTQMSDPGVYFLRSNETSRTARATLAVLRYAHRFGGGVPKPEVRTRATPHLPSQGGA